MKTKKFIYNFLTDIIPLIIISLLGIYKVKLFIQFLGNETLGLYNLFSRIMIYVALVDGGLSSGVLYSLYKPNTDNDHKKFNAILAGSFKVFSLIGAIVFTIAFLISFAVPFLIKDTTFDYSYVVITFLLFAINNVIGYFFVPYKELLEVKEKKYIYNIINQSGQIVLSISEIIMLVLHCNFELILIMHFVVKLIARLIEAIVCKKMYPEVKITQKDKNYEFKRHTKSLLVHKINGLISSNIDVILLSSFIGLEAVAIYSTYSYIITMLKNILGKLTSSMTAIIGNLLAKTKEKSYELYKEFNSTLFYIAIIICTPLTLAINGFIDIFYENEIYTSSLIAISFVAWLFTFIIKINTTMFVSAGGLYKETQYCAIVDTIVNLILSFVLLQFVGISGVVIATALAAFIGEYGLKSKVVHNKLFNMSSKKYHLNNIKFIILYVLDLLLGYQIISLFTINNLLVWFVTFTTYTITNAILIYLIFKLLKEDRFTSRFKWLIKEKLLQKRKEILNENKS